MRRRHGSHPEAGCTHVAAGPCSGRGKLAKQGGRQLLLRRQSLHTEAATAAKRLRGAVAVACRLVPLHRLLPGYSRAVGYDLRVVSDEPAV